MSRFMSKKHASLVAYTPGEQPTGRDYIKLNTNESPFPPSDKVRLAVETEYDKLQLYPDPVYRVLHETAAEYFGCATDEILMTNGSDEILNYAFMAFGDSAHPFAFPEISYGFYSVFAELHGIPAKKIPLKPDFTIAPSDYENLGMNIVIANPNAPTGLALSPADIERIVASNRDSVIVIDEAYVDFGGKSALPLIEKYDNLLVTRTFSKSYSLAGARLGFGVGNSALINDLNTIKYSTNPYNLSRMTSAAGIAAIKDADYYMENCKTIVENREWTKIRLRELGFTVTDSMTNFIFAEHPEVSGNELYLSLKEMGILVRHFNTAVIDNYNRITVGTRAQMETLVNAIITILEKRRLP